MGKGKGQALPLPRYSFFAGLAVSAGLGLSAVDFSVVLLTGSDDFVSVFVSLFVSLFSVPLLGVSLVPFAPSAAGSLGLCSRVCFSAEDLLSVIYQPEPLKLMPTGPTTRYTWCRSQRGHFLMASSVNFCFSSNL